MSSKIKMPKQDIEKLISTLMSLNAIEFAEFFTPILEKGDDNRDDIELLELIEDEVSEVVLNFDATQLSQEHLLPFSASVLLSYIFNTKLSVEQSHHMNTNDSLLKTLKDTIYLIEHLLEVKTEKKDIAGELNHIKNELTRIELQRKEGGKKPPQHYLNNAEEIGKLIRSVENKEITPSELQVKVYKLTKSLPDPKTIKKWREKYKESGYIY